MRKFINVCICGVQGYVGKALTKLVSLHPYLKLSGFLIKKLSIQSDSKIDGHFKKNIPIYSIDELFEKQSQIDVLLLATPAEASIEIVALFKNSDIKIIDLSGAFRLPQDELYQWYGIKHNIPAFKNGAPYGLSPWILKNSSNQNMLANPGCYATCALLSLIPLLQNAVIKCNNIIIDAKSGVSGAGKKANPDLMFCETAENFFPYKVGKHQHIPEIKNALANYSNKVCDITFVTHLLPIKSGISMSIYADANTNFTSDEEIASAIETAYQTTYKKYPLVKFSEINQGNVLNDKFILSLKNVVGTPNIHIGFYVKDNKVFIFSCIDNLLKGAASQAIENINRFYDLPLETGLEILEGII